MIDTALLAGGIGKRFWDVHSQGSLPKQFQVLAGSPVFIHSVRSLLSLNCFRKIIITVPKAYAGLAQEQINSSGLNLGHSTIEVVEGGERRQDSARLALAAMEKPTPPTRVLIHDACRPFLSGEFLTTIRTRLDERAYGAWAPVVPVNDTLKRVEDQRVIETVDRSQVFRVQTPQIFEYAVIRSLHEKAENESAIFTDDAALCEFYGIPVGVFEGDLRNIKLTHPFEMTSLAHFIETKEGTCESERAMTSML